MIIQNIQIEILQQSYWEHFNRAKELARYLPVNHDKRIAIENEMNLLLEEINNCLLK